MPVLTGRLLNSRSWLVSSQTDSWDALTPYSQVALGWKNASARTLANPFATTNHRAQRGDVPPGYRLGLFAPDGTAVATQQDNEAPAHRDGSFASGTLSAILPDTLVSGGTAGYFVKPVAGAPNRTPKFTLAAWSAANDLRLVFRTNLANPADDTANFEFRANDAATAGVMEGSSTGSDYPLTAIRVDRSGPVCMGWKFKGYARRKSDAAWHRTLVGEIYVTAVTTTDMLIDAMFSQPNAVDTSGVFNPAQTVGPALVADLAPILGIVELWNGAVLLHTWGGPNDFRKATFAAGAVSTANNQVTFPTSGPGRQRQALGYVFQSTGTLPGGLLPNKVYYLDPDYYPQNCWLRTRRAFLRSGGITAYQANTSTQTWGVYSATYVGAQPANGRLAQLYACTKAGTTGASSAPSGNADLQVDGTAEWTPLNAVLTSAGTGTLTAWPVVHVHPLTGAAFVDEATTDPIWTGSGPAPNLEAQKDLTYLCRYARALPPYDLTLTPLYPNGLPFDGYSVSEAYVQSEIDYYGDDPGTNLIGYLNVSASNALLQQTSAQVQRHMRAEALGWSDHWVYANDPRSFQPVSALQGPGNAAGRFPGTGPSMPDFYYAWPGKAAGRFSGIGLEVNSNFYNARYQTLCDGSHLPAMWMLPYEKTGRAIFLDQGVAFANAGMMSGSNSNGEHQLTLGGRTYSATWLIFGQPRGAAWITRIVGCLDDVLPAAHPSRSYFTTMVADALECATAVIEDTRVNRPLVYARGGLRWDGFAQQLWMMSYLLTTTSQEARKSRRPEWRAYAEYQASRFHLRWLDDDRGGNVGLADWNNIETRTYSVNPDIVAGDMITLAPQQIEAGSTLPAVSHTVLAGQTRAQVATALTALVNGTAAYTSYGLVATADEGNEWFRVRNPSALFNAAVSRAFTYLEPGGKLSTHHGTSIIMIARPTIEGAIRQEFATWDELTAFNLGAGWPQTNQTTISLVGSQNGVKGPAGDIPWDTTTYCTAALGALATMTEAGITDAQKIYDRLRARLTLVGGGPTFSFVPYNRFSPDGTGRTYNNFNFTAYYVQAARVQH